MWEIFKTKTQTKASLGQYVFTNEHEYASKDFKAYAKEGYSHNPTVYACISLIADAFGAIPLKVKVNGEVYEDHPLEKLLAQPNPDEGGVEFRTASCSWELLTGNNFSEKIKGVNQVQELWNWQPYEMSVGRRKGDRMPSMYTFAKNSANSKSWQVDPITGKSDILHWRTFNPDPENPSMGMAPLKAAAASTDQSNAASKWRYNSLKNMAKPSGLLSSEETISESDKKSLRRNLKENQQGVQNASEIMVLGGGLKWSQISMSPSDMDWLGGSKLLSQEIASVFRVPTQLLGIEGSQTYANYGEAKIALYTQAVLPKMDLYISELNRWLAPDYGDNVEICYSKEDIEALEPLRKEKRAELLGTNVLTMNEKRELLGYERIEEPEADSLFIQPNDIPLGEELFTEDDRAINNAAKSFQQIEGLSHKDALEKAFNLYHDNK